MELKSNRVHEILKEKGVETIYHANSVITACQFLRNAALLSRGTVDRRGLFQSPQASDESDRKRGLWFDVFTDSVDIHDRAGRANAYGPVLFVLDIQLIEKAYTGKIWVTKLNPIKWDGVPYDERWFTSEKDLEDNFVKGRFDQMIVFRHCGGELPIRKYLKEIVLDDPNLKSTVTNVDFYSMAFGALKLSMTEGQIKATVRKRACPSGCKCAGTYSSDEDRTVAMYVPDVDEK